MILKLLVNEWPQTKLSSDGPEFLAPIQNLTVNVGREAVLACSVGHLGRYKVAWVRAEDQTVLSLNSKVVTHNSRISVNHDSQHTWQLRIRQLKESDRGCYMCQINTSVLKTQEGCIDVNVPPDIVNDDTSGDLSVLEGENTTLWCKAIGHPTPRIAWRREDGHPIIVRKGHKEIVEVDIYNGSNLHFWRLDRKQMGAYLCIASNDVPPAVSKRIALSVNFAPVIKVPNQLLGAPLNTDVQLECYVEAFPNTINYWLKNRGEMLLNGDEVLFGKNDYQVKDARVGTVSYNKEFLQEFSVIYRKYNRTTKAINITILSKVDLISRYIIENVEVFKRYGNEFKMTAMKLSYKWCNLYNYNIAGLSTSSDCGRIACPIRKNIRQMMCNWIPDFSRLPPFIPDGEYLLVNNVSYRNQYLLEFNYFVTVYRKNDYHIKDIRIDTVTYNKKFLQEFTVVYRKHNRTTKTINATILSKVDLIDKYIIENLEVFKRYGNEFKMTSIKLSYKFCNLYNHNIAGLSTSECGTFSCPIRKNIRQTLCNWIPDFSRLPPFVPDGEYMLLINVTYRNQYLLDLNYFGTVYRKIRIE
ncbi:hypothetical protein FQR65_LT07308 [Abscondita terminalis]|nr:hypothetical protein FQR65_LT07308 [Abscondita terminalis]